MNTYVFDEEDQPWGVCEQDTHLRAHTGDLGNEVSDAGRDVWEIESVDDPCYLLEQQRLGADLWLQREEAHWQDLDA